MSSCVESAQAAEWLGRLDGAPDKADDETASTKSSTASPSEEDCAALCTECGVVLFDDAPLAGNGKKYCDPCWMLWGGTVCQAEFCSPCGDCDAAQPEEEVAEPEDVTPHEESATIAEEPVWCEGAPLAFKCAECNVEVSSDASSTADGMRYCEICWKKALPLALKRIQPKRARPLASNSVAARRAAGLRPSFRYAAGLELHPALASFDTSDAVCLQAGGFRHGEVVCDTSGREFAVVGARLVDGTPRLWFQPRDLGRPGAGCFPGASAEVLRARLRATGRRQQLREGKAQDFDEVEDSDGEAVLLCRRCRMPVGDFAYADGEDQGALHGECLAELVLERSRAADEARLQKAAEIKQRHRAEYGLGWRPERIPGSAGLAVRLGCSTRPRGLCCLVLDEESSTVRVKETFEPAGSVNLEYLSLALQVRRSQGTEPYFSLDPVRSLDAFKHRTQVKRFEPEWLAGTSVGAVMFQSDYHLKELSMGEYEQPVIGMKSCFDFSEDDSREKAWNAREWFVVNKAEVLLSEDNVLIPRVAMGVQAREQEETPVGMVDKPMTRPDHPLVKYAEAFTENFDLIAERRSAIFNLRELAKASVLAKFLDDTNAALEESWFSVVGTSAKGSFAEIPQLWNERFSSQIDVEDGRILDGKEGIRKGKHGVYGGVQFGLEEAVVAGTYRQRREAGRMLPEYMTIKLPRPSRFAPKGVDLNLGEFDLSAPTRQPLEKAIGSWGSESVGIDAAIGTAFWSALEGPETPLSKEDQALLRRVFNPHLSDRQAEREKFIPPDSSASYVHGLASLIKAEEQVRERRREHFLSKEFLPNEPGPLFPSSWTPPFEVAHRTQCGSLKVLRECQGTCPVTLEDLKAIVPLFDRRAEDGMRLRIYTLGQFEVRTVEEEGSQEAIGAVFATGASVQAPHKDGEVHDDHLIVRATEYVKRGARDEASNERPSYGMYAMLETEHGAFVVTELLHDGTMTWEENPVDLEDRNAKAKVVRTADCEKAGVCVGDIKAYKVGDAAGESLGDDASQSRCKHYVQGVFTLASTAGLRGSSGFWQQSEGVWQLLQAEKRSKQGRWEDGCWQAAWEGDWEGDWQDGWDGAWEDWQEEWDSGWQQSSHGGRAATMAAAKLPGAPPEFQKASRLRQHFELRAAHSAEQAPRSLQMRRP